MQSFVFYFATGDGNPLISSAASPVVALKTHFDSLANSSKKAQHHKKSSDSPFLPLSPSSGLGGGGGGGGLTNGVVSRFRLRQNGGSGGAGGDKKRHLERPLSQIICHLDSAQLLNNSPSFSILQPRSEERLSVLTTANSNSASTSASNKSKNGGSAAAVKKEEAGEGESESEDVMGIPKAVVQCLDDLENPPVPPLRYAIPRGRGDLCLGHLRHCPTRCQQTDAS